MAEVSKEVAISPPELVADRTEKLQVQVISRAGTILRALEGQPAGLSLSQIATEVGLPRSTVQRIAAALLAEQMLIAASPNGKLRLGPALLRLAKSVETDSVTLARPVLRALSDEIEETVDLATVRGCNLVFIDQIVGNQRLRTVSSVGEEFPLYCTANGKAYLATLSDDDVGRLVGMRMPRRTARTITDLPALLAELVTIRRSGVAFDLQEHSEGISAAGISLADLVGSPLLISVPVPSSRFDMRRDAILAGLVTAQAALSHRFQGAA